MSQKETKTEAAVARNNFLDRGMMGVASAAIVMLAYKTVLTHVRAIPPLNYVLAGAFLAFLLYLVVGPLFRR